MVSRQRIAVCPIVLLLPRIPVKQYRYRFLMIVYARSLMLCKLPKGYAMESTGMCNASSIASAEPMISRSNSFCERKRERRACVMVCDPIVCPRRTSSRKSSQLAGRTASYTTLFESSSLRKKFDVKKILPCRRILRAVYKFRTDKK